MAARSSQKRCTKARKDRQADAYWRYLHDVYAQRPALKMMGPPAPFSALSERSKQIIMERFG